MKQLRKAGVSQDDQVCYNQSVLRPVLKYACPCCQFSLNKEQTKQLKDVPRRASQVIFGNIPHDEVRRIRNILSVAEPRLELSRTFSRGSSETNQTSSLVSSASQASSSAYDSTALC